MVKQLPESWRKSVTSFSDRVFPGLTYYTPCNSSGNELIACLPLQVALYLNVMFFPFWILMTAGILHIKYDCLNGTYQFISITIIIAMIGVECIRLYLGYLGNLTEKIPELAAFWMLSILLQMPMELFLLFSSGLRSEPAEHTVHTILIFMLLAQLATGYSALKKAAHHHAAKFQELTQ